MGSDVPTLRACPENPFALREKARMTVETLGTPPTRERGCFFAFRDTLSPRILTFAEAIAKRKGGRDCTVGRCDEAILYYPWLAESNGFPFSAGITKLRLATNPSLPYAYSRRHRFS
jgi:hypothetical protein